MLLRWESVCMIRVRSLMTMFREHHAEVEKPLFPKPTLDLLTLSQGAVVSRPNHSDRRVGVILS